MGKPAPPYSVDDPKGPRRGKAEKAIGQQEQSAGMGRFNDLPEPTVRPADEESLNFNSIMKGTAANRMSLFEKKAALINA